MCVLLKMYAFLYIYYVPLITFCRHSLLLDIAIYSSRVSKVFYETRFLSPPNMISSCHTWYECWIVLKYEGNLYDFHDLNSHVAMKFLVLIYIVLPPRSYKSNMNNLIIPPLLQLYKEPNLRILEFNNLSARTYKWCYK